MTTDKNKQYQATKILTIKNSIKHSFTKFNSVQHISLDLSVLGPGVSPDKQKHRQTKMMLKLYNCVVASCK